MAYGGHVGACAWKSVQRFPRPIWALWQHCNELYTELSLPTLIISHLTWRMTSRLYMVIPSNGTALSIRCTPALL